ncbi:MAG: hypothetical protein LIP77_09450 [Planctomycetes bacterium]|nr:hypothetical protein [Planctomycetota bacterium]
MTKAEHHNGKGKPAKPFDPVFDELVPDAAVTHPNRHSKSAPKGDSGLEEKPQHDEYGDSMPAKTPYRKFTAKELAREPNPDELING